MKLFGVAILLIVVAVLVYGYWHGATHGAAHILVMDVSDPERPRDARGVTVSFLDSDGNVLAEGTGSDDTAVISISSPATYSCSEIEKRAPFSVEAKREWDECFERQSRWVPTWVRKVTSADLRTEGCGIQRLPVSLSEYPDTWWLWWLPVREIGGKPYTSYNLLVRFRQNSCQRAGHSIKEQQMGSGSTRHLERGLEPRTATGWWP